MRSVGFHILNLKRRTDRRDVMIGNLQTLGVPREFVTFHEAPDAMAYETTSDLCDDAVSDGFGCFENKRRGHRGSVACHWGSYQMIRHIASEENPHHFGYYNNDDILLKISYPRLVEIMHFLDNYRRDHNLGDMIILQMSMHYQKPHISRIDPQPVFPSSYIYHGLYGVGEVGLVFNKPGAAFLLEHCKASGSSVEGIIGNLPPDIPGTFHFSKEYCPIFHLDTKYWRKNYREDQDRLIANDDFERKEVANLSKDVV